MIQVVEYNLLEHPATFIAHQCNCVSTKSKGLSESIFNKWPIANTYSRRSDGFKDSLGGLETCLVGNSKYVINMYAQFYPGKPKHPNDTYKVRETAFKKCLDKIPNQVNSLLNFGTEVKNPDIAFPFGIGCGLAGGYWNTYYSMLEDFEEVYSNKVGGKVFICKMSK